MAISHVANRGTTTSKSASKTLAMSPSATLPVGALILVWFAWDNNNASTPDIGPISEQISCRDSVGNIWTTLVSGQNRGSPAGQARGVQGGIHICRLEHAITTSDTITVRLGTGNSLVAKAMSIEEFALSSSAYRWCLATFGVILDNNAEPSALSVPAQGPECLIVHALAAEGPQTDAYTWDSDYTQISGAGTTGSTDDTNVHVRGGYRNVSAAFGGDTIDVTSTTADREYWQGFATIYEFQPFPEFPTTPVLDNFNRANESPLSFGGQWITSPVLHGGTVALELVSNVVKVQSGSSLNRGQWWADPGFPREQEAYVTCTTAATGQDDGFGVSLLGVSGDASRGLRAYWIKFPAGDAASEDAVIIGRGDADSIERVMHSWWPMAAGVKLGLKIWVDECSMYVDKGGGDGWQWVSAFSFTGLVSGYLLALNMRDSVVRVDDFGGGGTIPSIPQTGRRLRHVRIPDL